MLQQIAIIEPVGGYGGMDYYDYGLAMGLGTNNIQILYYTNDQTNIRYFVNVETIITFKRVWNTRIKILKLYYLLKGYLCAFCDCKKKGIDIIHLHFFDLGFVNALVMLIAALFDFKKVLTLHDVSSFINDNNNFFEQFILKKFDAVIVHNKFSYKELTKKVSHNQIVVIIPHGNYLPFINELDYHPTQGKLNILFFGQIKKVKGLDILLKSIAILKQQAVPVCLTIAGKVWHDSSEKYFRLINELNIQDCVTTHFRFIPDNEVKDFFCKTDIVVLPYKRIYQSGVLLLSMSYGRTVLVSDLPAFVEIIENGKNGYTFKSENPESLAISLQNINNNKTNLMKIRNAASIDLRNNYDWNLIGEKTKHLYENILSK